jgi:hypothetical protein
MTTKAHKNVCWSNCKNWITINWHWKCFLHIQAPAYLSFYLINLPGKYNISFQIYCRWTWIYSFAKLYSKLTQRKRKYIYAIFGRMTMVIYLHCDGSKDIHKKMHFLDGHRGCWAQPNKELNIQGTITSWWNEHLQEKLREMTKSTSTRWWLLPNERLTIKERVPNSPNIQLVWYESN